VTTIPITQRKAAKVAFTQYNSRPSRLTMKMNACYIPLIITAYSVVRVYTGGYRKRVHLTLFTRTMWLFFCVFTAYRPIGDTATRKYSTGYAQHASGL